jgi:hypothetical protein
MEDVVVLEDHEDGCREHCHQPDSKHFAHLVTGRRVVGYWSSSVNVADASITRIG